MQVLYGFGLIEQYIIQLSTLRRQKVLSEKKKRNKNIMVYNMCNVKCTYLCVNGGMCQPKILVHSDMQHTQTDRKLKKRVLLNVKYESHETDRLKYTIEKLSSTLETVFSCNSVYEPPRISVYRYRETQISRELMHDGKGTF